MTTSQPHKQKTKKEGFPGNLLKGEIIGTKQNLILKTLTLGLILGLIYIANTYYAIKTLRKTNAIQREIKELKYEHIVAQSQYTDSTKQSRISVRAGHLGLIEPVDPPVKIIIQTEELNNLNP